jgi:glycosyltransferase involved in cell wall biosynthesis
MKQTKKQPLVSIIMPVHNAGRFLGLAINSIINQTHTSWELIAIDDGSTDNSLQILKNYAKKDRRINVFHNKKNLGVTKTANLAISKAKSTWIARMDADDIMLPKRLEIQLKTLQKHPSVIVIGSQCTLIDQNGKKIGHKMFPTCPKAIFNMLFWACPVQQPSIMVNTTKLPKKFQWYDPNTKTGEEINFLLRISKYGNIVNYRHSLLFYRIHGNNLSLKQNQKQVFFNLFKTRIKAVLNGQYKPSVSSLIIGIIELIIVSLLPNSLIMPTFQMIRGMKEMSFTLHLPTIFPNIRTFHISA